MNSESRVRCLKNTVKYYGWGSKTAIPQLLGIPNPQYKPFAELWIGAHPMGQSLVLESGAEIPLSEYIKRDPENILGKSVSEHFNQTLPFLLKILAAAAPLSIQAHPDKAAAKRGFERETLAGLSMDHFQRSFKDNNHKPELICALTPFWVLKGFRPISDIIALFKNMNLDEIKAILEQFTAHADISGLKIFYSSIMTMSKEQKQQVTARAAVYASLRHQDPVCCWIGKLYEHYAGDAGVLSPIFLNLVRLNPGDALFISPGELHSYLEGMAVEIMASSDNVIRSGLTSKYMDASEILSILDFRDASPDIIKPAKGDVMEKAYPVPAEEFGLSAIHITSATPFSRINNQSFEILLCVDGRAALIESGGATPIDLPCGASIMIPACVPSYSVQGQALVFRAWIPSI